MRTKDFIMSAAFSLFKEYRFDKITVSMIIEHAGVSRKTFYNYFQDKYELLNLYYQNFIRFQYNDFYNGQNWRDVLINLGNFIDQNRSYFINAEQLSGDESIYTAIQKAQVEFYSKVFLRNMHRDELTDSEKLKIEAIGQAILTIYKMYLYKATPLEIEDLADVACEIMPQSFYKYLDE